MMGKTHVFMGTASALLLTVPQNTMAFCAALMGGAIGGILCDVDVKGGGKLSDTLVAKVTATGIAGAALLVDHLSGGGLMAAMMAAGTTQFLLGAGGFVLLCIIGGLSDHRGFTHSLLAMGLFGASVYLFCLPALAAFLVGYGSHILLDLLNKRPLRLLFPLKKGVCLKLFYANKLADQMLLSVGILGTGLGLVIAVI